MSVLNNFILDSDYATIKEIAEFDKTFNAPQVTIQVSDDEGSAEVHMEFDAPNLNGVQNYTIELSGEGYRSIRAASPYLAYFKDIQYGMLEIVAGIRKTSSGKAQIYASYYAIHVDGPIIVPPLKIRVWGHIFTSPFDTD